MKTLASSLSFENGKYFSIRSGMRAVSACISPSIIRSGAFCLTISVARAIFSDSGIRADPKLENDSMAIRGWILKACATLAAPMAISANCSAVGLTFTVVSANR